MSKILINVVLNIFLYLVYIRFFDKIDFGIVYFGFIFSFFVFYVFVLNSVKDIKDIIFSYFSILFISTIFLSMKFLSLKELSFYVEYSIFLCFFYILNIFFKEKLKVKYEFLKDNFAFLLGGFISLMLLSF